MRPKDYNLKRKLTVNEKLCDHVGRIARLETRVDLLTGMAGAKTATETAMNQMSESYDLYRWLNGKTDKRPALADKIIGKMGLWTGARHPYTESNRTAGDWFCGRCGKPRSIGCCSSFVSTPDFPLHARVAGALEYTAWTDKNGKWRSNLSQYIPLGIEYPFIPDYPNDRDAAMGALEEYCREHGLLVRIGYDPSVSVDYAVGISRNNEEFTTGVSDSLPQAICEAIVKHAEQQ